MDEESMDYAEEEFIDDEEYIEELEAIIDDLEELLGRFGCKNKGDCENCEEHCPLERKKRYGKRIEKAKRITKAILPDISREYTDSLFNVFGKDES